MLDQEVIKLRATSPFSRKNQLMRVLWILIEGSLFRWSPRPLHIWRSFLLKSFGAKIGKGVHIYSGVRCWAPWNLEIGEHSGIANGVTLYSQGKIKIGKRCVISQNSYLCTGSHNYNTPEYKLFTKPIEIGSDCWLAADVFVHPGVSIADGVIVGARSVVVGDLPSWSVCVGNPCNFKKKREKY